MKKFFKKLICKFLNHKWKLISDVIYPSGKKFDFNRCKRCGQTDQKIINLIEYRMAKAEEQILLEMTKRLFE